MKTNSIPGGRAVRARAITPTRHLAIHRTWLWTGLLAFTAIASGPQPAQAAVIEAWVQRHSNVVSIADWAVKVVRDEAGDIIVTGATSGGLSGGDMLTIKYSSADGSMLWRQFYNSPENGADWPRALAVDGSGNVVVTGISQDTNFGRDYYTAKYAATDGALLWEQLYNGSANGDDWASAMVVDGRGNVVVTGVSGGHFYTAKYAAADGELLWEQRHSGPANSSGRPYALAVDASGSVVVTGYSNHGTFWDCYTAKYAAADGALLWEKFYNGPANSDDWASAVAVDGSGNVVVTGTSSRGAQSEYEYYTAKYGAVDGELLWEQRYSSQADVYDQAHALALDGNGNVVVTGNSSAVKYAAADGALLWERRHTGGRAVVVDGSGNVVVTGSWGGDYYTAKYAAAEGALLWEQRYNGPVNNGDEANAVAVDSSGNVVVTGTSGITYSGEYSEGGDYYTAKYASADGALVWERRYSGSAPAPASAQAVAVDGSGNVAVTGFALNPYNRDFYTAKYAAADGALLWERRYNGTANGFDEASALAVDGSGNVVVTGSSPGEWGYDYYTAKYAAANGALLWERRYNGLGNSADYARAVAVDARGNVVVTGSSYKTINHSWERYTAKYAAADGALLWERRHSNGQASAVAVDGAGNVMVIGHSDNGTYSSRDYYTAKYAAADGALLWERRYNGPANGYDEARAVAVDGIGDVVVTGSSGGDYYTAKYAAADGALLWEKRHSTGYATAVAVDGSGNAIVTGTSVVSAFNGSGFEVDYDYYTAKYSAGDGALLWEKRYSGAAKSSDWASAVAVDGSGNVFVTGTSGFDPNSCFYTAKYAAADGALLWEKRFTGPASAGDSSHRLALGGDGIVAVTGTAIDGYETIVYREVPEAVSIDLVSTGIRLRFSGVAGRSHNIERAPALTGPWRTITTQTAPASGLFEYLDSNPLVNAAFYRASEP